MRAGRQQNMLCKITQTYCTLSHHHLLLLQRARVGEQKNGEKRKTQQQSRVFAGQRPSCPARAPTHHFPLCLKLHWEQPSVAGQWLMASIVLTTLSTEAGQCLTVAYVLRLCFMRTTSLVVHRQLFTITMDVLYIKINEEESYTLVMQCTLVSCHK